MYIHVSPNTYVAFFRELLDKFIEIELKGDVTEYPDKMSRQLWGHWDKEKDMPRASVLFETRHKKHLASDYFRRRYDAALNASKNIPLIADSFTKAFHYVGYDYLGDSKEGEVKKAELQFDFFEKLQVEKVKQSENQKKIIPNPNKKKANLKIKKYSSIAEHQKFIGNGTYFVEKELPEIIENLTPKRNFYQSITFIDIDGLTQINKKFGKHVGDRVIEEIDRILQSYQQFRYTGRCGDDTFYGVLLYTNTTRTIEACEKLKHDIETTYWAALADKLRVTCSIGTAILKKDEDAYSWLERGALGMLAGKAKGGNTVELGPQFLSISKSEESDIDMVSEDFESSSTGHVKKSAKKKGKTKEERIQDRQRKRNKGDFSLRTWFS